LNLLAGATITDGSVLFADSNSQVTQDNSNFFWDNTNKRLGLGTNTPATTLELLADSTQLRLSYDGSNYVELSASSYGSLVIDASGDVIGSDDALQLTGGGIVEGGFTIDDLEVDTSFNLSGNLESSIVPDTDNAYDIGGVGAAMQSIYVGTSIILDDDATIGQDDNKITFDDDSNYIYTTTSSVGIGDSTPDATLDAADIRVGDDANYVEIDEDGDFTLAGDARVWVAMNLTPLVVKVPGEGAPEEDNIDAFACHRYDRSTEESVYYQWQVPENFATGDSSVRGFYEFVVENPPVSPDGDEVVRMGFEYKNIGGGEVFDFDSGTSTGAINETIEADETPWIIHRTAMGVCTTTNWQVRDTVLFRFYRDATDPADTYDNEASASDNDVWMFMYHLEYLVEKLGGPLQ